LRARDAKAGKVDPVKNAEMAKLYRKHILGEKEQEGMGFVSLGQLVNTARPRRKKKKKKCSETSSTTLRWKDFSPRRHGDAEKIRNQVLRDSVSPW